MLTTVKIPGKQDLEAVSEFRYQLDRRQVQVHLTAKGERCLPKLAGLHKSERESFGWAFGSAGSRLSPFTQHPRTGRLVCLDSNMSHCATSLILGYLRRQNAYSGIYR